MGTFFDSFMPALTGDLAQMGPAAMSGQMQGNQYARDLALLDMQLKQQQLALQKAQQPQWEAYQPGTFLQQRHPITGQVLQERTIPDPYKQSHAAVEQLRAQFAGQQAQTAAERAKREAEYKEGLLGVKEQLAGLQGQRHPTEMVVAKFTRGEKLTPNEQAVYRIWEQSQKPTTAFTKPPSGYRFTATGELEAIPGGPADLKIQGALNQDTALLEHTSSGLDRLAISANELLHHPGLKGITGLRGAIPNVPGSAAADAQAKLATLKSQIGFGVLQEMRNNSKTGGALGQVSDKENVLLQNNLAALDQAQSYEQLQESLRKLIQYRDDAMDRLQRAFNMKHKVGEAQGPAPITAPGIVKPKQATPQQKKTYDESQINALLEKYK